MPGNMRKRFRWLDDVPRQWRMSLALLVFGGLLYRITYNVDLSDESYYAIFVHDWLIVGIRESTLATLHQTAALVIFPFVLIYAKIMGSMTGLMLFLRCLYLLGEVISAFTLFLFVRDIRGSACAWLAVSGLLAFIPFGLPAPSYNTLGLQGMTVALACFGLAANRPSIGRGQSGWILASAIGWTVAVTAYPTLALPFGSFCLTLLLCTPANHDVRWRYVSTAATTVFLGLLVVTVVLTPAKIYESISYLNKINNVSDMRSKISSSLQMVGAVPSFSTLIIITSIVGVFRTRLPVSVVFVASGSILSTLQFEEPAFFMRSHDAMTLMALSGLGLLSGLRSGAMAEDRTTALIILASLIAGATTAATATNGAFNFCIGCAPAAILTLAVPRCTTRLTRGIREGAQACLVLVVALSSVSVLYGDDPSDDATKIRIRHGIFAGLSVQVAQARLIEFASTLDELEPAHRTIAEFGRYPGLILPTKDQILSLTAFALQPNISPSGLTATRAFYDDMTHRPGLVILFTDRYTTPINPMQAIFASHYAPCRDFARDMVRVEVFCRSRTSP